MGDHGVLREIREIGRGGKKGRGGSEGAREYEFDHKVKRRLQKILRRAGMKQSLFLTLGGCGRFSIC